MLALWYITKIKRLVNNMGTIQKVGDVEVVSIEDMNTEHYTDTTGASYKTSSIHVYTDKDGNYRSFSDDTKKHIERCEKSIERYKEWIEMEQNSPFRTQQEKDKNIALYRKWIAMDEKLLERHKKWLMKGL